jgi:hypothetical protein
MMRIAMGSWLAATVGAGTVRGDVTLVRDGKPMARIYITVPAAAPEAPVQKGKVTPKRIQVDTPLADAATEINYHLKKMSGAELEVVSNAAPADIKGPAIVLGDLAVKLGAEPQKTSLSKEGFRIRVKDSQVLIGGESDMGALFGVYELLNRLGCEWVMPGEIGEIIPVSRTVVVPAQDDSQTPDFAMRRLWYRGYRTKEHPIKPGEFERFVQWLRRQKCGNFSHFAFNAGGHVWDAFIKRHKADFDKDPTMLALRKDRDGQLKRMGPQLESTHPRVIELFAEDIKAAYAKNIEAGTWTKDTPAGFGIGPADGLGYSMSPESLAAGSGKIDPMVGELDRTDEMILMANRILENVHRDYPNAYVGFYSYSTHSGYPTRYTPDPKIVQIFAPINFSRFHGVCDTNSPTQQYYRGVVERWGALARKQGNPLVYRGYSWNLADNMLPYTKVRIWGEELPFYKQQNMLGLNVEGTKMWSVLAPSDYVFMKLAWNTQQDWKKLLRQFCEKAYGGGADAMEAYHLALIERQHAAGQEAGSYHAFPLMYDAGRVRQSLALIDGAAAAAKTEGDKARVGFSRHNVEALQLYLDYYRVTQEFDFPAIKRGFDAMRAHWDQAYALNSDLVANEAPGYLNRYLAKFVNEGLKYSSDPYRIVLHVPDELPTRFDEKLVGHGEGYDYEQPKTDDSGWRKTRTISSNWSAQGLAADHRSGAVWYRFRFTLPADLKDQPIGLFAGGFEDEMRVWVNGQLIGTSGRRFSNPAEFDLTDSLKPGQENLLAMQIVRNSAANEIGLGGIIRPCFLFAGPRLEQKAPGPQVELRRVLPGGELGELE